MNLKQKKKQLVAAAMAVLLSVGTAVPTVVASAPLVYAEEDDSIKYTDSDGNVFEISRDGTLLDCRPEEGITKLTIPKKIQGITIKEIGSDACCRCKSVSRITIPNSVTVIGDSAFFECEELTEITIPNRVTKIGTSAFNGCKNLEKVTLSNSVKRISMGAFSQCYGLTDVYYDGTLEEFENSLFTEGLDVFDGDTNLHTKKAAPTPPENPASRYNFYPKYKDASGNTFFYQQSTPREVTILYFDPGSNSKNVVIPDTLGGAPVRKIASGAFAGQKNIQTIKFPSSLFTIESEAFDGCSNLKEINLPVGVTTVGKYAFRNCTSLTKATLPGSIRNFGTNGVGAMPYSPLGGVFTNCTALKTVTLGEISSSQVGTRNLAAFDFGFAGCPNLQEVTIPSFIGGINYTFRDCNYLTNVNLPGTLNVSSSTFANCKNLKTATIGSGINTLSGTFVECSNLKSVYLPKSIKTLDNAFRDIYKGAPKNYNLDIYYEGSKEEFNKIKYTSTNTIDPISYYDYLPLSEYIDFRNANKHYFNGHTITIHYNSYTPKNISNIILGTTTHPSVNPNPTTPSTSITTTPSTTPTTTNLGKGSIMLDTANYIMAPGNIYDVGVTIKDRNGNKISGDAAKQLVSSGKMTVKDSRTGSVATLTQLPNGNFRVTGKNPGTCYIVYDIGGNHASVKIDVQNSVKQHGTAVRNTSYFTKDVF